MLSADDTCLIRRDPLLPGLPILLDSDAFLEVLRRRLPQVDVRKAQSRYIRYKKHTHCLMTYRLDVGGRIVDIHAKAYSLSGRGKLLKDAGQPEVSGPLGSGRILLENQAILVLTFPNDSKVKSLGLTADRESREQLLRQVLPEHPALWKGQLETLAYRPDRRYVAQLVVQGKPEAVVRFYTHSGFQLSKRPAKVVRPGDFLRVARPLGQSNNLAIRALEWMPGLPLLEAQKHLHFPVTPLEEVGLALAELHIQSSEKLGSMVREKEAASLLASAVALGVVRPDLDQRVMRLASQLVETLIKQAPGKHFLHGNFCAKQVLLQAKGITLINMDSAVRGDPEADLGNFLAHQEHYFLAGRIPAQRLESDRRALLEGYKAGKGDFDLDKINLYTAIGLLRLAIGPFRDRESAWQEKIEQIVELVEAMWSIPVLEAERGWLGHRIWENQPRLVLKLFEKVRPLVETRPDTTSIFASDPVTQDPRMPYLTQALDPATAEDAVASNVPGLDKRIARIQLQGIQVVRYTPQQSCLIEYDFKLDGLPPQSLTLLGKVQAQGLNLRGYHLMKALWRTDFRQGSKDRICVPEPLGIIPEFNMCLQRKVPGRSATKLLAEEGGVHLARRIAEMAHKVHQTDIPVYCQHTMEDELRILGERLSLVAKEKPQWRTRLKRIYEGCERLGRSLPKPKSTAIHRDFYADQILVDNSRLYLTDWDLCCEGDPAFDVGNFVGHITEWSLRRLGEPKALSHCQQALEEHFIQLSGEAVREAVGVYTILTLARHIQISTEFPERRAFTEPLLQICEEELHLSTSSKSSSLSRVDSKA